MWPAGLEFDTCALKQQSSPEAMEALFCLFSHPSAQIITLVPDFQVLKQCSNLKKKVEYQRFVELSRHEAPRIWKGVKWENICIILVCVLVCVCNFKWPLLSLCWDGGGGGVIWGGTYETQHSDRYAAKCLWTAFLTNKIKVFLRWYSTGVSLISYFSTTVPASSSHFKISVHASFPPGRLANLMSAHRVMRLNQTGGGWEIPPSCTTRVPQCSAQSAASHLQPSIRPHRRAVGGLRWDFKAKHDGIGRDSRGRTELCSHRPPIGPTVSTSSMWRVRLPVCLWAASTRWAENKSWLQKPHVYLRQHIFLFMISLDVFKCPTFVWLPRDAVTEMQMKPPNMNPA